MKYSDWKNEKSLDLICKKLLDNADLDYQFSNLNLEIELTFYVAGSDIKVLFYCSEITKIIIEKEYDDHPIHLVLEVNVIKKGEYFQISVLPEFNLFIECKRFTWLLKEFQENERKDVYGSA